MLPSVLDIYRKPSWAFSYFACCWLFLFGMSLSVSAQNWEYKTLVELNINRNTHLDPWAKGFSNSVLPLSLAFPVADFLFSHQDKPLRNREFLVYTGGFLAHTVVVQGLKYSIQRTRPFNQYDDIEEVMSASGYSFPSGHTALAFHSSTLISFQYPKWYVIGPAFLWAGAVGYSRMHLGVHYPTDVLGGALLGVGTGYLTFKANQWIRRRYEKRKK